MGRVWLLLEGFFGGALTWGVVALVALALALSGRLSISAARFVLWLAFGAAVFGVYRATVVLRMEPVMRFLVLGCCAFGFAAGIVALGRWMAVPKTEDTHNAPTGVATLREPVIHVEPEDELVWSTKPGQKIGEYRLTLSNTGTEDIDHIRVTEDYFVALKLRNGGIIVKNLGGVPVESGACTSLGSKQGCPVLINFAPSIEVMNEVARNNGVPHLRGVRLTITFRRRIDGMEYRVVKGYGIIGPHAEGLFPPGVPQDDIPLELRSQFLSMSEIAPYLDLREYWTSVVHEIGQDSEGHITSRYY